MSVPYWHGRNLYLIDGKIFMTENSELPPAEENAEQAPEENVVATEETPEAPVAAAPEVPLDPSIPSAVDNAAEIERIREIHAQMAADGTLTANPVALPTNEPEINYSVDTDGAVQSFPDLPSALNAIHSAYVSGQGFTTITIRAAR